MGHAPGVRFCTRPQRAGGRPVDGRRHCRPGGLRALADAWQEILPAEPIRTTAERLLRVHPLRAADSLQLAAAIIAAEREPTTLEFVSLDDRLGEAASREGFRVVRG